MATSLKLLFLAAFLFSATLRAAEEKASLVLSPRDFGAVGDGTAFDTVAFQKAIDASHDRGGGTVHVPAGTYLIGTIDLRTGVTLDLGKDSTLLGSPHVADYRRGLSPALIKARGQERIAITGSGTIDGQGKLVALDTLRIFKSGQYLDFFPGLKPGEKVVLSLMPGQRSSIDPYAMFQDGTLGQRLIPADAEDAATHRVAGLVRPEIIEFLECREVRVSGVTIQHAANLVQTYRECEDVVIEHIRVDSTTYWNNDGIDVINSRRVRIEHCDINASDDGICLKSDPSPDSRGCADITVSHCRIRSSASAFKIGTGSYQGFRHIRVSALDIYDTYRSAVAVECVDGGVVEDIEITGIRARNTGNAIFIRLGQRNAKKPAGLLRNVLLSDISVQVPAGRPDEGYEFAGPPPLEVTNLLPSSISGLPEALVENVTLRNVTIVYGGGALRTRAEIPLTALKTIPEKREAYPEFSRFGELPAWGLFVRHAKGIRLENVSFKLEKPDYRSALVADDVRGFMLDRTKFLSAGEEPVVVFSAVSDDEVREIAWPNSARERLRRINR